MTTDQTQTGPTRQGSTERCTHPGCGHTKRDHSGRRDHQAKGYTADPWCHACETACLFEPAAAVSPPTTPADTYEQETGHLITRLAVAGGASDPDCCSPATDTPDDPERRDRYAVVSAPEQPTTRADVYAEVADRLGKDAETGDKEGLTRIYRRSAAKQVREWGEELRRMAGEEQPTTETHEAAWRPVPLATPCILCEHPFNWHDRKGCQYGNEDSRCGCRSFAPGEKPAPVDPRSILGVDEPAVVARQDGATT